jgi:hypothetical protein
MNEKDVYLHNYVLFMLLICLSTRWHEHQPAATSLSSHTNADLIRNAHHTDTAVRVYNPQIQTDTIPYADRTDVRFPALHKSYIAPLTTNSPTLRSSRSVTIP